MRGQSTSITPRDLKKARTASNIWARSSKRTFLFLPFMELLVYPGDVLTCPSVYFDFFPLFHENGNLDFGTTFNDGRFQHSSRSRVSSNSWRGFCNEHFH